MQKKSGFGLLVDLHVSATHISGKDNLEADKNSRKFQDATEWQLNPEIYKDVCDVLKIEMILSNESCFAKSWVSDGRK